MVGVMVIVTGGAVFVMVGVTVMVTGEAVTVMVGVMVTGGAISVMVGVMIMVTGGGDSVMAGAVTVKRRAAGAFFGSTAFPMLLIVLAPSQRLHQWQHPWQGWIAYSMKEGEEGAGQERELLSRAVLVDFPKMKAHVGTAAAALGNNLAAPWLAIATRLEQLGAIDWWGKEVVKDCMLK